MCKNRVLCKKCAILFRKLHTPKALCHRGFQQSVQLCNFFQLLSQTLEIKNIRYRKIFFIKGINGVGWKLHNCTLCRFGAVLITKLWMMIGQDKDQLRSRPGLSQAPRWSSPGPGPAYSWPRAGPVPAPAQHRSRVRKKQFRINERKIANVTPFHRL